MTTLRQPRRHAQVLRYLLAGGLSAACNFGARIVLSLWLPFEAAVAGAYVVGLVSGFFLMKTLAFPPSSRSLLRQMGGYALVHVYGGLQTLLVSSLLLRFVLPALGLHQQADMIAHAVALLALALSSYHGHRKISFR